MIGPQLPSNKGTTTASRQVWGCGSAVECSRCLWKTVGPSPVRGKDVQNEALAQKIKSIKKGHSKYLSQLNRGTCASYQARAGSQSQGLLILQMFKLYKFCLADVHTTCLHHNKVDV